MADISQVKLPNGDTYNLVDETSGYITLPDLPVYDGTVVEDGDGYVSVVKSGKAFTYVGEGTYDNNTYVEYNITYNDFINARNNGTNIVYTLTDVDELRARNIVAFDCTEESEYYKVKMIYAQVTAGTPFPTVDWIPLTLFCDTTDGYMRDINCWEEIS